MPKILVNIDGKEIEAFKNQTILEICKDNDIDVPTLCYNEKLENFGACGLCVVEIEGANKLFRSCSTKAQNGMIIKTTSNRIRESRKTTLELLLSYHTGDCKAPCTLACPANVDVQGYVGLIANEEYGEALKLIKEKLPFPASVGRVCPHPCQTDCRRDTIDNPISIAWLKRYAGDIDLAKEEPYLPKLEEEKNKTISIIGGGPSGLSAAFFLRKKGYKVRVYEAMPEFGGMLKYGIPLYRLPKEVLLGEIKLIEKMGAELIPNIRIGKDISFEHIRENSDAVYVAIGAWKSSIVRCEGSDLKGVHGGIEFLNKFAINDPIKTGKRIAVIGGGNTAMDSCRTAIRLGAEKVYAIYRRTKDDMPAVDIEIEEALEEGVESKFLLNPAEIINDGNGNVKGIKLEKMVKIGMDARGRSKVEPTGEYEYLDVDSVIMSIGQKLDNNGLETIELNKRGNIESKEKTFETNLDGVFAGGDCINDGADIAIHAVADGKDAAIIIERYLNGDVRPISDKNYSKRKNLTLKDYPTIVKQDYTFMEHETPETRKHNFEEVVHGYTPEDAIKEAEKCLECGCKEVFKCDLLKYLNEYDVDPERLEGEKYIYEIDDRHPYIIKDSNKCIHCGMCVRVCDEIMNAGSLGLVNRGFKTVVLPALDKALDQTNCLGCGQCVNVCPTGALQEKMDIKKPIPVIPDITNTVCSSCSIGCKVNIESKGSLILKAIPDYYDETSGGLLCAKGKFEFNCSNDKNRLLKPLIRKNGKLVEVSFQEAILYAARKAQSLNLLNGGNKLGVTISDKLMNEEIYLAKLYANEILKSDNVFNLNGRKSGLKEILGIDASTNTLNEINHTDVVITIGADLMKNNTIAGIKVKKAFDNGATIININSEYTKADDWADISIIEDNISENIKDIYLGLDSKKKVSKSVKAIIDILNNKKKIMFIFDESNVTTNDEIIIASIAKQTKHLGSPRNGIIKLRNQINSQGLVDMEVSIDADKYLQKIVTKDILGLFVIGNELPKDIRLNQLDLLIVMATHLTDEIEKADVIIPMATFIESEGIITTNDRRILKVNRVIDSKIGYSNLELIIELMNVYSTNFKFKNESEIQSEICKNIHNYDGLCKVDSNDAYWPIDGCRILFSEDCKYKLNPSKLEFGDEEIKIIIG